MLKRLFEHYFKHPEALPEDFQPQLSFDGMERTVCDYIAGMTDNYAVDKFHELFTPMGWQVRGECAIIMGSLLPIFYSKL